MKLYCRSLFESLGDFFSGALGNALNSALSTALSTALNSAGRALIGCLLLLACHLSQAEEVLNIEGGAVTGNREQPKVLYIIPWQAPEGKTDLNQPITSQIKGMLEPIDRAVTLRDIENYRKFSTAQTQPVKSTANNATATITTTSTDIQTDGRN